MAGSSPNTGPLRLSVVLNLLLRPRQCYLDFPSVPSQLTPDLDMDTQVFTSFHLISHPCGSLSHSPPPSFPHPAFSLLSFLQPLPSPSSPSLYDLLSLGKFPRGYWQGLESQEIWQCPASAIFWMAKCLISSNPRLVISTAGFTYFWKWGLNNSLHIKHLAKYPYTF